MLTNLSIQNIAVIQKLDVDIPNGMCVLTGETGAGKSIIIDSINMILGARTNKSLIRYGQSRAVVQAVFIVNNDIEKKLETHGIPIEDQQLIITREITTEGKSVCRINGIITPLSILRELNLIDIHGQHDNQALLTPAKHILFLDSFAQNNMEYKEYISAYIEYQTIKKEIESLNIDEQERVQKIDLLQYQTAEIQNANLVNGEEEQLNEQQLIIENAEKIMSALKIAYQALYDNDNEKSAYDTISTAEKSLSAIADYDETLSSVFSRISDVMYTIEDCAHEVHEYMNSIDYDEATLNTIQTRLDEIAKLRRKYGNSIEEILTYYEKAQKQLQDLTGSDERLTDLENLLHQKSILLSKYSQKLYETRKKAGEKLQNSVENILNELDMPKVKFQVNIVHHEEFFDNGGDKVEFLISTNPGEPLKPLVQIASGGELSRIMLAIKSILADADSVDTLIFDEIDTGVSGSAAQKIALKLMQIAKKRQVICISHLPQIVSYADHQFLIKKHTDDDSVSTSVCEVCGEEREQALARMIDGTTITQTSIKHSRQMLDYANKMRHSI